MKNLICLILFLVGSSNCYGQVIINNTRVISRPINSPIVVINNDRLVYSPYVPNNYQNAYYNNPIYNRLYLQNQQYFINQYYLYGTPPPAGYLQWRLYNFGY